jgi:hypothetical protein
MLPNVEYSYWITNAGPFSVTWGLAAAAWVQSGTNPVIASNAVTLVRAVNRGGFTNAWVVAEKLLELVMGEGMIATDNLTAIPQTRTLSTRVVTNKLYAAAMVLDASTDVHASGTNAIAGNVTLLLTNAVIGRSGSLSLLSDGSARTIAIFAGPTLTWISTNATSAATNLLTTASKQSLLCWRVSAGATASPSTNIHLWAQNQP